MKNGCVLGVSLIDRNQLLRRLPSVEALSLQEDMRYLANSYSRPVLMEGIRRVLEAKRQALLATEKQSGTGRIEVTAQEVEKAVEDWTTEPLRPVINATGVVIHTNLGRAPLSKDALGCISKVAASYSNLELNLNSGRRSSRTDMIKPILKELTGAEDALVVNNNAAAVYLALRVLAFGKEVVVSRGELVEIGGSFRIPDVMAASGAKLVEVGTTNRTRLEDYQKAISPETALLLKVHRSNFEMVGFTQEAPLDQMSMLSRKTGVPFMMDMGAGTLLDGPPDEMGSIPTIKGILRHNPDLICFSGDKMLGGPQSGILLGRKRWIAMLAKDPMARALRVGKLTLAALWATFATYRGGDRKARSIPVVNMLMAEPHELKERAERLLKYIQQRDLPVQAEICHSTGRVGGGAMPLVELPGFGITLMHNTINPDQLAQRLRMGNPAVVARLNQDRLLLDIRTVLGEEQLKSLAEAVGSACSHN